MRTGLKSASSVTAQTAAAVTASLQRKRAPLFSAMDPTSSASATTIPAPAKGYQRRNANIADTKSAPAQGDAAHHGLDARITTLSQREQAGEAFGQPERASNKHETANVRHAARGDRHCRRISDEDGGDSKSQLCGFIARRQADP
jgi:hypothetical protein